MNPQKDITKLIRSIDVLPDNGKRQATLEAMRQAHAAAVQAGTQSIWRTIMQSRTFKVSAAAVILVAVLISLTLLPTQSAYANIAEQLRQAQTFTFTWIKQTGLQPGDNISVQVAYKAPGIIRCTTADGLISVNDTVQGRMILLMPQEKTYILADYKNMPKTGPDLMESIRQMQDLPAEADATLGKKEIDGVLAQGYRVIKDDTTKTIWIDAKTQKLIQFEQEYPSSPGMNYILRDIRLDEELDDSLFSTTPPEGYKEGAKLSADASQVTEADLIGYFKLWIDATKDKTFPPGFVGPEFRKVLMELDKQGKFARGFTNEERQVMFKAGIFLHQIPEEDWRYTGSNVPFGDPARPVFWYRPSGSEMYRVIYADLSVREVSKENLPQ